MHTTRMDDVSFIHDGDYEGDMFIYGAVDGEEVYEDEERNCMTARVVVSFDSVEKFIIQKYIRKRISEVEQLEGLGLTQEQKDNFDNWDAINWYINHLEKFDGDLFSLTTLVSISPFTLDDRYIHRRSADEGFEIIG